VLNLPLRQPPAVLARATASLDLLSGGRTSLGLGAGFFWDAVHAIGGRRLTPMQGVTALGEAIDVIRGIWDADGPGTLHVEGEFYQVRGTERGPAPAHNIPIWLGAHKPKMQDLVGRKADGWLPSLPVMEPGGLPTGNAIIDDAARAAGRDPRDITRLLNIFPGQQTAETLAQMTLQDGVSIFILASDDPDTLQRFAAETIPAVRDHVARGRT
jgi:alkanesulfonate monooxygenase SsuD/methylene tetrahydromethanopterin reductase-like flavin-dependent oxidoreductase (luciferase family)